MGKFNGNQTMDSVHRVVITVYLNALEQLNSTKDEDGNCNYAQGSGCDSVLYAVLLV